MLVEQRVAFASGLHFLNKPLMKIEKTNTNVCLWSIDLTDLFKFTRGFVVVAALSANVAFASVPDGITALEAGDVQEAAQLFQTAYDAGDAEGAFYLGRLFELGLGTDKDMRRATSLYALAAEEESVLAQNRLGLMYLDGEFVLQDFARAAELICAAAESGDANGQFNCGLLYAEGKGVTQDDTEALRLWEAASTANHIAATNYLAAAYKNGTGTSVDLQRAGELFGRTAMAGNPLGLYELARAYAAGTGVDQDSVQAHAYANLAAVRGVDAARTLRDEVGAQLDADALNRAQTIAREWQAVPLAQPAAE
jgi:TPR repeat protein